MTRPVEPGEIIAGKYQIVRRVGKGGMGVVFEARHVGIGRRLAVKFLRTDLAGDEKRLLRFQREARHCGALHHENIAAVLDFATDDATRPYIVMEFVEGSSLRELIDRAAPLEPARACELIRQAARGVGAAHEAGILHRDLKPENLMLTRRADGSDWVKLLDFGVARLTETEADAAALTREGQTPGTPHYLAPELARGDQPASVASDVYSLGVVLFELLTGKRPHPDDNYNAVLRHVADEPAPSITTVRSDLPPALAQLVDRALSRDPAKRPESAQALLHALDARSSEAATVTSPDMTPRVPRRRAVRPWLPVALLILVAAGVGLALNRRPDTAVQRSEVPEPRAVAPTPAPPADPTPVTAAPTTRAISAERTAAKPRPARAQRDAAASSPPPTPSAARTETPRGGFDRNNPYRD